MTSGFLRCYCVYANPGVPSTKLWAQRLSQGTTAMGTQLILTTLMHWMLCSVSVFTDLSQLSTPVLVVWFPLHGTSEPSLKFNGTKYGNGDPKTPTAWELELPSVMLLGKRTAISVKPRFFLDWYWKMTLIPNVFSCWLNLELMEISNNFETHTVADYIITVTMVTMVIGL